MKLEQAATSSDYRFRGRGPIAPIPPAGGGWRLVAAIPTSDGLKPGVIWYWEREVTPKPRKPRPKPRPDDPNWPK